MKKLKKILLVIPVMLIALYSKVSANALPPMTVAALYGVKMPSERNYRYLYWIILVPLAVIIFGIIGFINVKMKDNPKKKKIAATICLIIGVCILVGIFFVIRTIISGILGY